MNQQGPSVFLIRNEGNKDVEEVVVVGGEMSSRNSPETKIEKKTGAMSPLLQRFSSPHSHTLSLPRRKERRKDMQDIHVIHRDIRDSLDSVRGKMRV